MALIPAIADSDFLEVKRIIDNMTKDSINLVTNGNPPMTFYDIALQHNKEENSKSSNQICVYMRNNGAKTYEELLAEPMYVNRNIPLAIRGPHVNIKNRGIASLTRRNIPKLKLGGGGYSRKRKQTRRGRKFVKHIY